MGHVFFSTQKTGCCRKGRFIYSMGIYKSGGCKKNERHVSYTLGSQWTAKEENLLKLGENWNVK